MRTPILQFGTSRFLQAHADLFLSEARAEDQDVGPITVVQTSGSPERAKRVEAFNDPAGFPVRIRGVENGAPIDSTVQVRSVAHGLSTVAHWSEVLRIAVHDASSIITNTADAGFAVAAGAQVDLRQDSPVAPPSFPEKLLAVLAVRYRADRPGLPIFPCELIERNGDHLKGLILDLARRSGADPALLRWLGTECIWANSLVDRIVSAPIDPVGAVAEPYALWAIERQPGLEPPCRHPAIRMVDDLEPVAALKLYLLNLAHTVLAENWSRAGVDPEATVRELMADAAIRSGLLDLYERELIPGFAAHGMEADARDYVRVTVERFDNPFLDHRLADILIDHRQKVERRVVAFLAWSAGARSAQPRLTAIAARHGFVSETSR